MNPRDIRNMFMSEQQFLSRSETFKKKMNNFKVVTKHLLSEVETDSLFDGPREVFLSDLTELLTKINRYINEFDTTYSLQRTAPNEYELTLRVLEKRTNEVKKEVENMKAQISHYQQFELIRQNPDDSFDRKIDEIPEQEEAVQLGEGRNPYALLQQKGHEGKFTAQFKARKPHLRHLKSLEEFAHYILAHPTEFNKISKQRANYYRNLIQRGSGNQNKGMTKPETEERRLRQQQESYDSVEIDLPATQRLIQQKRDVEQQRQEKKLTELRRQQGILYNLKSREYGKNFNPLNVKSISTTVNARKKYLKDLWESDRYNTIMTDDEKYEYLHQLEGRGRLTKKMMKDLRAYHKQVGGKISTQNFNLMLTESYKKPQDRKNIGDYQIDESLSTPESVVYHNPKTGETKVAYRGTEGTLADWSNNAKYALGLHNTTKRYKRANETQKQVEQKYGTDQLDVLGHSQSGAFSSELAKNAKNVIVLNPASHPLYTPKTKNTTVVRSKGDSVSALKYLNPFNWGKKADVEIEAKTYNPITEHMPDILERLPEDQMLGNGRKRKKVKRNKKLRNLCDCGMCFYCG